jgi:hypothetical protein
VTIGGVAVAGYMIWRAQKKNAAQQAATSQAEMVSAYGYNAYGYGQGSLPEGFFGYGEPGMFGYGGGLGGGGVWPGGSQNPPPPVTPPAITTNAEWAQAAIKDLSADGFSKVQLAEALGAYELGREVTPAQRNMISAAIGVEGEPPVPGKDDFPPKIRVGSGGQGGQGGTHFITAPGGETLPEIGRAHGDSVRKIDGLNGTLFMRYGNKRNIPKGMKVRIS